MPIQVQIEGKGQVAEFPDGTDQTVIDATIKRDYFGGTAVKPPEESFMSKVGTHAWDTLSNVPESAANVLKGVGTVLWHPIDTIQGLADLAAGGVTAGVRELTGGTSISGKEVPISPGEQAFRENIAKPIAESIKNPTGIPGRIGTYTEKHPIEQLMNISAGMGLAGKATGLSGLTRASELTNPMSLITKPIAAGMNAFTNKVTASGVTPEITKNLKLAKDTGVPLTPVDITGKKSQAILEMQLKENVGSANIGEASKEAKSIAIQNYAERLKQDMGGQMDKLSAGQITQESSAKIYKAFQDKAAKLYGRIPIDANEMLDTKSLSQIASEHYDELGKINNATIKRVLSTIGNEVEGFRPKPYLWKELIADQQKLREMASTTRDFNKKRIYSDLVNSINADISSFSQTTPDTAVKGALDAAVSFYRDGDANLPGIRVFRDRQIANMMKTTSPEDIVNNFIKATPNSSDMRRLREVAGPKAWKAIKQSWLQDMTTKGAEQSFSPAKFATAYDKYRQGGNLDVMLNRTERTGLDKLYNVSKIINTAENIAGNPSGTGRIYLNAAASWVAHPIIMTVTQIGANRLAELYFNNPSFQRFLIQGLDASSNSSKAITAANELVKIAAKSGVTNIMYQTGKFTGE